MDNDIKIFHSIAQAPGEDLERLAAETEELRENGELERAKRLGRAIAAYSVRSAELLALAERFGFSALAPEKEQQLHVLTVFSGYHALRGLLQPRLLAEAAVTAMNNFLINRNNAFWNTISDGGAFTQYLLAVRSQEEKKRQADLAGETFAHLCGQEDNPDLRQLGTAVFAAVHELVIAGREAEA